MPVPVELTGVLAEEVLRGVGVDEGVYRLWRPRGFADSEQSIVGVDLDEHQLRVLIVLKGLYLDDLWRFCHVAMPFVWR